MYVCVYLCMCVCMYVYVSSLEKWLLLGLGVVISKMYLEYFRLESKDTIKDYQNSVKRVQ